MDSQVNLDEGELAGSLSFWKRMLDEQLVLGVKSEENKKIDNILFYNNSISLLEGDDYLISPPVIDKNNPLYGNRMEMLCINKYSKKADLAAELLALYLSDEVQFSLPLDVVLDDLDSFTQPDGPGFGFGVLSNKANRMLYRRMMEDSYHRFYQMDFNMFFGDTVEECLGGRITPDAAAKAIIDKAKMIVGE